MGAESERVRTHGLIITQTGYIFKLEVLHGVMCAQAVALELATFPFTQPVCICHPIQPTPQGSACALLSSSPFPSLFHLFVLFFFFSNLFECALRYRTPCSTSGTYKCLTKIYWMM